MPDPIVYIDRSTIRSGSIDQVRRRIAEVVDFIEAQEPQLIHYGFYLDDGSSRMTVIAVHPDPSSVERHMEVGGPIFRSFAELIDMEAIEVYGPTTDHMLEQLHAKAAALGEDADVVVDDMYAGFARLPPE